MKTVTLVVIIAITFLAAFAIYRGIDGALLAGAFTILGGLGGYSIGKHIKPKT